MESPLVLALDTDDLEQAVRQALRGVESRNAERVARRAARAR